MKTITQLRKEFEDMAKGCIFDIVRLSSGEYKMSGRNTFFLWAGYWECAKNNGIIIGKDAEFVNMSNFILYPVDWLCQNCGKKQKSTTLVHPKHVGGDPDCCLVGSTMNMVPVCSVCKKDLFDGSLCRHQEIEW